MTRKRLLTRLFQSYWRLSRSLTLDVRACVRDAQGRVALVRNANRSLWQLPGGIVEQGETAEAALSRLLALDPGLEVIGNTELFAIYAGAKRGAFDQRALFLVPSWRRVTKAELVNAQDGSKSVTPGVSFFDLGGLPHDVDTAVPVRLAEICRSRALSEVW